MSPYPTLYALEFKEHPEYLHARITASFLDRTGALSYLSEIFLECAKLRKKKLLLERATPCMMQRDELYSTMDFIVSVEKDTRIAFLNAHGTVPRPFHTLSITERNRAEDSNTFRNFKRPRIGFSNPRRMENLDMMNECNKCSDEFDSNGTVPVALLGHLSEAQREEFYRRRLDSDLCNQCLKSTIIERQPE
jgi:hypothetical protein